MKTITVLAVGVGLIALAGCQKTQENNVAENVEMNAPETMAPPPEMNAGTENMDMNATNVTENTGETNTTTNNAY
jgi:hypothetical protein